MKKFLSIVAVIALVFMLAVPAFAANSSSDNVILKDGETITVNGKEAVLAIASIGTSSEKPDDSAIGVGNELVAVYEVALTYSDGSGDASAAYFNEHSTLGIDFGSRIVAGVNKVLHLTGGSWKQESLNGTVVTVSGLSPFALIKAAGTTPAPAPGKRSPQTGYNTVLWAISAAAMVACAGYCFANARRKDAE